MTRLDFYRQVRESVSRRRLLIARFLHIGDDHCALGSWYCDSDLSREERERIIQDEISWPVAMEVARANDEFVGTAEQRRDYMLHWLDAEIAKMEGETFAAPALTEAPVPLVKSHEY